MSKKLIALIVSGLLVIALIIYFIFIYDFNKSETPDGNNQTNQEVIPVVKDVTPLSVPSRNTEDQTRDQAAQRAIAFAERFGSSSSQSDFSNLSDLELFMTADLQTQTKQYVLTEQQKPVTNFDYTGITTKAIVPKFTAFDASAGTASVTVATKRQEENSQGEVKSYNQNLKLTMKKLNNDWKVDTAEWEK